MVSVKSAAGHWDFKRLRARSKLLQSPSFTDPYSSAVLLIQCSPLQTISFRPDSVQDCGCGWETWQEKQSKMEVKQLNGDGYSHMGRRTTGHPPLATTEEGSWVSWGLGRYPGTSRQAFPAFLAFKPPTKPPPRPPPTIFASLQRDEDDPPKYSKRFCISGGKFKGLFNSILLVFL